VKLKRIETSDPDRLFSATYQGYEVFAQDKDIRYFVVVISPVEMAQLTNLSGSTPQMYSVAVRMFLPSATAAE